jgi:hypothetical protein
MQFIRNNLFYVILGGLTTVIVVAELVYPLLSGVDEKVAKRTKLSGELEAARNALNTRQVNEEKLKAMTARGTAVTEASKGDEEASLQFNRRNFEVLQIPLGQLKPAFPISIAEYAKWNGRLEFTTKYCEVVASLLKQPRLRAVEPPDVKDVDAAIATLTSPGAKPDVIKKLARQQVMLEWTKKGALYVGDKVLDRVFTEPTNTAPDEKLWEAQVNLWATEEVLRAIITTNEEVAAEREKNLGGGAEGGITDSAVRHLLRIKVEGQFAAPRSVGAVGEAPTITRRYSTARYAVQNYDFTVIMPTRHVERLLRTLMLQNFHAVHRVNLSKVSLTDESLFYYGPEEVMQVDVAGELLLLRSWINPLMPKSGAR